MGKIIGRCGPKLDSMAAGCHWLCVIALIATVQLCAVTADESPAVVEGDVLLDVGGGMGKKVPLKVALKTKLHKITAKNQQEYLYHSKELAKADVRGKKATKKEMQAQKKVIKSQQGVPKLVAKFEHTIDPAEAAALKKRIEFLRKKATVEQQKANAAHANKEHAKFKSAYHKAELKRNNIKPPVSKKTLIARTKRKAAMKFAKKTNKLRTHLDKASKVSKMMVIRNKNLLKKLDKFANKRAAENAKKLEKARKEKLQKQLNKALTAASGAATPTAARILGKKVKELEKKLGVKKSKFKMKKFDPIMYLTPRGRIFVKALRKKIRRQSGVVSKLMANYSRDMKHATDVIGKIKKQVTVTKGKKLFDLDKKLKKWNIIRFKLKNNNKKKVMVEKNHLKKLKSREKKLLAKAPKKKKKQVVKGKKAMSKAAKAAKTAKKAAADIKKVAAKMEEKRKANKGNTALQIKKLEAAHANTPAAAR